DRLARLHRGTGIDEHLGDGARVTGLERLLHLHRLDHGQGVVGFAGVAGTDGDGGECALHGSVERVRVVGDLRSLAAGGASASTVSPALTATETRVPCMGALSEFESSAIFAPLRLERLRLRRGTVGLGTCPRSEMTSLGTETVIRRPSTSTTTLKLSVGVLM